MNEMNIKVMMPKVELQENELSIVLDVAVKTGHALSIALNSICFINRFGETFEYQNKEEKYYKVLTEGCRIRKTINLGNKKQSLTNSQLILCFVDITADRIYTLHYSRSNDAWKIDNSAVVGFGGRKQYRNPIENIEIFHAKPVAKLRMHDNTEEKKGSYSSGTKKLQYEKHESEENRLSDEEIIANSPTSIKDYVKSIFREMYFIREKGGRRYKVTNGKFLKVIKNQYIYIFDIDSEIFIAEDSPVRIEIAGKTIEGSVFYTNGFQIMISTNVDIGRTIFSGFIMVEPWKLLRQLGECVSELSYAHTPIAMELLAQGPQLSNPDKSAYIRKGQEEAISYTYNNRISIIWGPPGTGKSYIMAKMTKKFVEEGKSVLLVSHSNISVDVVINKIVQLFYLSNERDYLEAGNILRYGFVRDPNLAKDEYATSYNYALKKDSSIKQKMNELEKRKEQVQQKNGVDSDEFVGIIQEIRELRKLIAEEESRSIKKAKVVGTTVAKLLVDVHIKDEKYDVVMFDEASMAYVGQIAAAAGHAVQKFVCVGDFNQLAPICQSEQKDILEKDIFSHLNIVTSEGKVNYHPWLTMLDVQRRTHSEIVKFASKYIYQNMLKTDPEVKSKVEKYTVEAPFENHPLVFIDLAGTYGVADSNDNNSRYNIFNAMIAVMIAKKAVLNCKDVGIITPYAAQARLIRAMMVDSGDAGLLSVKCATVHQFQGSECDVIIYDTVENFPFTRPGILLKDNHNRNVNRLVNVAITRAKSKFIMIANSRFWNATMGETQNTMYLLVKYMMQNGKVIGYTSGDLKRICADLSMPSPMIFTEEENAMGHFEKDVAYAKSEVIVCIPDGCLKENYEQVLRLLLQCQKNVPIGIKCNAKTFTELPERWKQNSKGTDNAVFPVIIIDNKVLWYGLPSSRGMLKAKDRNYNTVCSIYFRYVGEKAIEIFDMFSQMHMVVAGPNQRLLIDSSQKHVAKEEGAMLTEYVNKKCHCSHCRGNVELKKSGKGKFYLKCVNCGEISYLTPEEVNNYISENGICCSRHKSDIQAKVSQFGIYAWCIKGCHAIDLFNL